MTANHATQAQAPARNGLGIAGLILGIVAILFGLVPLTFWIAGPLGVTGLILALVGRARVKRGEATNGKTALFGVLTSIGALALSIWGATIVLGAIEDAGDELDRSIDEFDSYVECVDAIEIDDPDFDEKMTACEE
jgi:hypothetical protein